MRPGVPQNRNAPDVPKEQCFFFSARSAAQFRLWGWSYRRPARGGEDDGKSVVQLYDRGMQRSSVESRLSELVHAAVPPSDLAVAAIVAGVPVEQTQPTGLRDIDVVWPQDEIEQ